MKRNLKSKIIGLSALGFMGGAIIPTTTGCSNSTSEFFTVKNNLGLEIEFCDVGASIYSIKHNDTYLTYHPTDKNVFMDKGATPYYYGKTLGRVAGRFADGKFDLDGTTYQLQLNETGAPKNNCLHGGNDSFSFKSFKHYINDVKGTTSDEDRTVVAFNYYSQDGEAGFPAAIDAWVVYSLYKNANRLDTTLFAIPTAKTIINMSTHSLFRLGNDGDIKDYKLTIPADYRVEYDKEESGKKTTDQTVKGIKSVEEDNKMFDFRLGKTIKEDLENVAKFDPVSNGYDHIWYLGDIIDPKNRYVQIENEAKGITFKVTAMREKVNGFIIYANCYPREGQIMQGDNKADTQYAGITVEPYTYFSKTSGDKSKGQVGIEPITYTPDNPFFNQYSYEWTFTK